MHLSCALEVEKRPKSIKSKKQEETTRVGEHARKQQKNKRVSHTVRRRAALVRVETIAQVSLPVRPPGASTTQVSGTEVRGVCVAHVLWL